MKFTSVEAEAIISFVINSPLAAWGNQATVIRTFSAFLGTIEVAFRVLVAFRRADPRSSALARLGATRMSLTELSF